MPVNTPVKFKAGTNGEVYLNDLPYQRGSLYPEYDPVAQTLSLFKNGYNDNVITACYKQHYSDILNGDNASAPFASWQDLIDYVSTAFFLRSTGGGSAQKASLLYTVPADGVSVDIADLNNRVVTGFMVNGGAGVNDGFDKPLASTILAYTDSNAFTAGQKLTIFLQ